MTRNEAFVFIYYWLSNVDLGNRRMEVLNADLALANEVAASKRSRKMSGGTKRRKIKDDHETSFHFVAFVPINGSVWRLDGLQRQPLNLGGSAHIGLCG